MVQSRHHKLRHVVEGIASLSNSRVNLSAIPDNASTELIDLISAVALPKNIEILSRITSGTVTIGRYIVNPNPGIFLGYTQHAVTINEGAPFETEWLLPRSGRYERKRIEQDEIDIYPQETLVYRRWQTSPRLLFFAITPAFVDKIITEVFDRSSIELKPKIGIRDIIIEGMAQAWRDELRVRGAGGRVYAEALATALVVHLFRSYGNGSSNIQLNTGGMNGMRLRRVLDYVEEHLGEDIGLFTLAEIAGYSVHHFNDVFKAETGFAPHQFLIERRIHRAKELLLGSDMPIAQVAVEMGFSGQSHFTEHFRKLTGTTPLRFRQVKNTVWTGKGYKMSV